MKAFKIIPHTKEIVEVEINTLKEMQDAVGGYITTAMNFDNGDTLFVDDEGLMVPFAQFFEHKDGHQPFAGNAILVGPEVNGKTTDVKTTLESFKEKISFLTRRELVERYGL